MTTAPAATRLDRPASVTTATALVALAALATLAHPLWFLGSYGPASGVLYVIVLQALVPATAYAVCVPGLWAARSWARVAITALAAVHVLGALPNLVLSFGSGPDPVLLAYLVGEIALAGAVALLWTSSSRAWFGPLT